jgi:hypothetical protein
METPANAPKFVRWAIVLGIVVVLNIFFVVVRALVFPAPQLADYCPAAINPPVVNTAAQCDAAGGVWTEYGPLAASPAQTGPKAPNGYCDFYAKCQPIFDAANSKYELYAFVLSLTLGLIAVVAGIFPLGSSIVSSGLSYGGVVAFIVGSASYWGEAGNWVRLIISVIALGALIYIGLKRFRD